ncbi:MAG: hypothetical protein CL844_05630 [Crocinitomicaceae bacterium]|nr:hypothetical protein [Crocinitomicaceae bacterium]
MRAACRRGGAHHQGRRGPHPQAGRLRGPRELALLRDNAPRERRQAARAARGAEAVGALQDGQEEQAARAVQLERV